MSWYLKYRPKNIEELGSTTVRQSVVRMLSQDQIPHAFLLAGPRGLGKTSTARIIAQYINCLSPRKVGVPCGKCSNCRLFDKNQVVDIVEIDAASNRKIDDIRQLRSGVGLAPSVYKYKVYIIDEVHMLTKEAFNALLKTLEEPPGHVIFILATTEIHKVPATIKSRCQIINYNLASQAELLTTLKKVADKEKLNITDEALLLVSKQARGSFRDAIKLLEQISHHGQVDTALLDHIKSSDALINDLFTALVAKKLRSAVKLVDRLEEINYGGDDLVYQLEKLMSQHLSDLTELTYEDRRYLQKATKGLLEIARDLNSPVSLFLSLKAMINGLALEFGEVKAQPPSQPVESAGRPAKPAQIPQPPVPKLKPAAVSGPKPTNATIDKPTFDKAWQNLVEASVNLNHGLKSLFKMSKTKITGDDSVELAVANKLWKQMLDRPKIKNWMESFLAKELKVDKVRLFIIADPSIKKTAKASPANKAQTVSSRQKVEILLG